MRQNGRATRKREFQKEHVHPIYCDKASSIPYLKVDCLQIEDRPIQEAWALLNQTTMRQQWIPNGARHAIHDKQAKTQQTKQEGHGELTLWVFYGSSAKV